MDVVALGDHLRSDQDIQFMISKSGQDGLGAARPARRIPVEASNASVRESPMEGFLNLFGAFTDEIQILARALRAQSRDRASESAVMAKQASDAFVMRQCDAAVGALNGLAATAAEHECRIPAAIHQDQVLL